MSIFFPDILDDFLKLPFLQRVKKKYHFEEHQMDELKAVAGEMLPLMLQKEFSLSPCSLDISESTACSEVLFIPAI